MKRVFVIMTMVLLVVCMCFVSCEDDKKPENTTAAEETTEKVKDTTAEDTTEEVTTEVTTEETTKAAETTKKADVTTKAPAVTTQPQQPQQQSQSGGGSLSVGGSTSGGQWQETYVVNNGVLNGNVACPVAASTKDAFNGAQYILTKSGKKLVHTYSDRAVISEDNSTARAYMPMQSTTVFPKADESYNTPQALLKDLKPGFSSDGVLVGYDGYMFYQDTINDFIGEGFLHDEIYNRAVKLLSSYSDFAKKHGMKFYFVIAPNKNSVYPDYMPDGYTMASYRRYDQFVDIVNKSGITAVDLRGAMTAEAKAHPAQNLYYKYDTHWNNHAGYVAYQTTMNLVRKDYPNAILHARNEYQVNYCETYMKDQAFYLGYYSHFKDYGPVYTLKSGRSAKLVNFQPREGWGQFAFAYDCTSGADKGYSDKLYYYKYRNEYNTSAPNAYILRDSYSIAMAPFLKDSFYESTYNWTFNFEATQSDILASKADVVIMIVAERNLRNMVNNKAVND